LGHGRDRERDDEQARKPDDGATPVHALQGLTSWRLQANDRSTEPGTPGTTGCQVLQTRCILTR
jgi:hypothetical protein